MRLLILLTVFTILFSTCIDPFDPGIEGKARKLVVDGLITNLPDVYTIRLTYSEPYNNDSLTLPVDRATVYVTDDLKNQYNFNYTTQGNYLSDTTFRGEIGRTYTLYIRTVDGKMYESKPEKMLAPPPMDTIFSRFVAKTDSRSVTEYYFEAFIRTTDPKETENYYQWRWTHYEQLEFCQEKWNADPRVREYQQFKCCTFCWSITRCRGNDCNQVESDLYFNGNSFEHKIAKLPFDSKKDYFMVVDQFALSERTYRFWKTVLEQLNNTGGIFDVPPSAAVGNIFNPNDPNEQALGIFNVAGAARYSVHLDRSMTERYPPDKKTPEPRVIQSYCLSCDEKYVRTGKVPPGW